MRRRWSPLAALVVAAALVLPGCAAYTRTPRLAAYDLSSGYRFEQLPVGEPAAPRNSDELFVVLAFSGGGTRAAALSYGVLEQLRQVKFHWNATTHQPEACQPEDSSPCRAMARTLLDEVDVISSVSGGSFTSAYFALHGDGIFDPNGKFHTSFLYYPVQRDLLSHAVYYPKNWLRLRSRVEIAADDYARNIFGDATFGALPARGRPYLIMNATDASTGARFEFTQEQFDLLCADLSRVPIARGVAASSAFPGLLNSMTVDSFNADQAGVKGGCGYAGPGTRDDDWVGQAMNDAFVSYRRYNAARQTLAYRDPARTHLHLLDGGLSDNIGLRSVLQSLASTDRPVQEVPNGPPILGGWSLLNKINLGHVKTVVVITVNARTDRKKDWDAKKAGPSTIGVLGASSGIPMGSFSTETVELLREYGFDAELNQSGGPRFYGVEVAFENLRDPAERAFLSGVGTNFELAPFEVNCLIDRGAQLLRESSSVTDEKPMPFETFVTDHLKGRVLPPAVSHPAACTVAAGHTEIKTKTRSHYIDIGPKYSVTVPASDDVDDDRGWGVAVRVAKPNGFGATAGFGTESFDVPATIESEPVLLGRLRLRTLSGGLIYTKRVAAFEASAGLSVGYGWGAFTLDDDTRERYARRGTFGIATDATNAWMIEPNVSVWHNLNSRWSAMMSASYVLARPSIRVEPSDLEQGRKIRAAAFRLGAGIGFRVF